MAQVTLPDGSTLEITDGTTAKQLAEQIGPGLANAAVAAKLNGQLVDLSTPIRTDAAIQIITLKDAEGLQIMRHSCAHIMAEAICSIWPDAKLVYGPTVEDGFYYDIELDESIRPTDFERIEEKIREIIKADKPIIRKEMTRSEALEKLAGDKYKTDNIKHSDSDIISFYSHGDGFEDLCRGPHVPSTGKVGSFKVMSVAGAYWHGDPTQKMLQRVYGTAWATKKELDDYLRRLEEAKKRDHRVLGKQLDLFSFNEAGPGFAFIHPKGMIIWSEIIGFLRSVHTKYGYREIQTPIILNEELWHKSGHWDNYKENMYFTSFDETGYAIKPMNCPGGCLVYKTRQHSYRELPMRIMEFGLVHRHEASGVMHGLFRVRQFTQDDAHIYCTPDQIESEIVGVIEIIFEIYKAFGYNTEKTPVMIHRAILGSFERFIGILIEHYAGSFPLWLSPQHVKVLPISEKSNDYARAVQDKLKDARLRCGLDVSDEKVNAKIAKAHAEKLPYMVVVGPKEAQSDAVNVRIRGQKENKTVKIDEFITAARGKIADKQMDLAF